MSEVSKQKSFSLWNKTWSARILRGLLLINLILVVFFIRATYWTDCPVEFHILLNDVNKTYETRFKGHYKARYYLRLIDPHPSNFEESQNFLNTVKLKVRVVEKDHELAHFTTGPSFDAYLVGGGDFTERKGTLRKSIGSDQPIKGEDYYYCFQLLEVPPQYPNKKEVIVQLLADSHDPLNSAWGETLILSTILTIFVAPITLIFALICYQPQVRIAGKNLFPILIKIVLALYCFILMFLLSPSMF